jgi:predicted transcriptional regulator
MSTEDSQDDDDCGEDPSVAERLEEGASSSVSGLDEGLVDLLSWVLETETRARIYVQLRQSPWSTSDEIADGTGLYPSTVREALAALHEEAIVERRKREAPGAGNNPYEYTAMAPSDLVGSIVEEVQTELNTVFNLDTYLGGGEPTDDPVHITVASGEERDEEGAAVGERAESDD